MSSVVGYMCMSPSDPSKKGLLYATKLAAEEHQKQMDALIAQWPEGWNVDFWKNKPECWKIYPLGIIEEKQ